MIVTLFFLCFFQSCFPEGQFIPSYIYLFIKGLIFGIPYGCLLMRFFVPLLFFIQSGESVYDDHDLDLLYDIYNTLNEHN